jgi:DnaJ-class molecular chaperone
MADEMTLASFNQAVETLGLVGKIDRKTVRQVYLLLCKEFHPDMPTGDHAKFQAINDAYELIMDYIESFRFDFDEKEFKKQYPLYDAKSGMWLGER